MNHLRALSHLGVDLDFTSRAAQLIAIAARRTGERELDNQVRFRAWPAFSCWSIVIAGQQLNWPHCNTNT